MYTVRVDGCAGLVPSSTGVGLPSEKKRKEEIITVLAQKGRFNRGFKPVLACFTVYEGLRALRS